MQKLTWQLQEGLVKFTGGSLVAAAGHPQALVDAVRLSLGLPLPFNHESSGDSGSETEQWQEETEELQSRAGHRVQITAGRVRWISNEVRKLGFESGPGKKTKNQKNVQKLLKPTVADLKVIPLPLCSSPDPLCARSAAASGLFKCAWRMCAWGDYSTCSGWCGIYSTSYYTEVIPLLTTSYFVVFHIIINDKNKQTGQVVWNNVKCNFAVNGENMQSQCEALNITFTSSRTAANGSFVPLSSAALILY